tara:strand:+ start:3909 stop:4145 length:237 start_codon:yes stop_codon:yes gene_type:complete
MTDVILINNVKAKSISYRPVSKKAIDHVKKTIKSFDGGRVKVAYDKRYALWTELTESNWEVILWTIHTTGTERRNVRK